jgi:hypothetical protein
MVRVIMDKTFTQTSHEPYDRHNYRLYLQNGKVMNFDNWEDAQVYWFTYNQVPDYLDFFEVLDKPKEKVKSKGFR